MREPGIERQSTKWPDGRYSVRFPERKFTVLVKNGVVQREVNNWTTWESQLFDFMQSWTGASVEKVDE